MKRFLLALAALLTCSACLAGAWGAGSFDNDDAMDWVQDCIRSEGTAVVSSALQTVLESAYIEAHEGSMAIAAAEVVAAAQGKPGKALPASLSGWLARQPKRDIAALAPLARKALMRVRDRKISELPGLWSESGDPKWSAAFTELEARLR